MVALLAASLLFLLQLENMLSLVSTEFVKSFRRRWFVFFLMLRLCEEREGRERESAPRGEKEREEARDSILQFRSSGRAVELHL